MSTSHSSGNPSSQRLGQEMNLAPPTRPRFPSSHQEALHYANLSALLSQPCETSLTKSCPVFNGIQNPIHPSSNAPTNNHPSSTSHGTKLPSCSFNSYHPSRESSQAASPQQYPQECHRQQVIEHPRVAHSPLTSHRLQVPIAHINSWSGHQAFSQTGPSSDQPSSRPLTSLGPAQLTETGHPARLMHQNGSRIPSNATGNPTISSMVLGATLPSATITGSQRLNERLRSEPGPSAPQAGCLPQESLVAPSSSIPVSQCVPRITPRLRLHNCHSTRYPFEASYEPTSALLPSTTLVQNTSRRTPERPISNAGDQQNQTRSGTRARAGLHNSHPASSQYDIGTWRSVDDIPFRAFLIKTIIGKISEAVPVLSQSTCEKIARRYEAEKYHSAIDRINYHREFASGVSQLIGTLKGKYREYQRARQRVQASSLAACSQNNEAVNSNAAVSSLEMQDRSCRQPRFQALNQSPWHRMAACDANEALGLTADAFSLDQGALNPRIPEDSSDLQAQRTKAIVGSKPPFTNETIQTKSEMTVAARNALDITNIAPYCKERREKVRKEMLCPAREDKAEDTAKGFPGEDTNPLETPSLPLDRTPIHKGKKRSWKELDSEKFFLKTGQEEAKKTVHMGRQVERIPEAEEVTQNMKCEGDQKKLRMELNASLAPCGEGAGFGRQFKQSIAVPREKEAVGVEIINNRPDNAHRRQGLVQCGKSSHRSLPGLRKVKPQGTPDNDCVIVKGKHGFLNTENKCSLATQEYANQESASFLSQEPSGVDLSNLVLKNLPFFSLHEKNDGISQQGYALKGSEMVAKKTLDGIYIHRNEGDTKSSAGDLKDLTEGHGNVKKDVAVTKSQLAHDSELLGTPNMPTSDFASQTLCNSSHSASNEAQAKHSHSGGFCSEREIEDQLMADIAKSHQVEAAVIGGEIQTHCLDTCAASKNNDRSGVGNENLALGTDFMLLSKLQEIQRKYYMPVFQQKVQHQPSFERFPEMTEKEFHQMIGITWTLLKYKGQKTRDGRITPPLPKGLDFFELSRMEAFLSQFLCPPTKDTDLHIMADALEYIPEKMCESSSTDKYLWLERKARKAINAAQHAAELLKEQERVVTLEQQNARLKDTFSALSKRATCLRDNGN